MDGSLPFGRFETRLVGVIVAADPEAAAEREAAREREQFAKRTRSSEDGTAGFYVRSSIGVIARLDASVAYVAAALLAFGDIDPLEVRRVKAMLILATPTQAVQVLAAYAAHRVRSTPSSNVDNSPDNGSASGDVEPPVEDPSSGGCGDSDEPEPPPEDTGLEPPPEDTGPETGTETGPVSAPESALDRMDAFARRVGFTPRRMPTWLTVPDTPPDTEPGRDRGGETADGAGGDRGGGPGGRAGGSGPPGFVFDWTTLLPQVTLNLHVADETIRRDADPCHDGDGDGGGGDGGPGGGGGDVAGAGRAVIRWDGEGPVTLRHLYERLAPYHPITIQPVIDLAGMPPVDAYELPDRHRRAVRLRTPAAAAPFSTNLDPVVDADHTVPYDPDLNSGPAKNWSTRLDNLAPLSRFDHRLKTHGHWTVRQPFNGILIWRDPHGQIYLVDHTGTHKITRPGHPAGPATSHDPDIDLYPAGDVIQINFAS